MRKTVSLVLLLCITEASIAGTCTSRLEEGAYSASIAIESHTGDNPGNVTVHDNFCLIISDIQPTHFSISGFGSDIRCSCNSGAKRRNLADSNFASKGDFTCAGLGGGGTFSVAILGKAKKGRIKLKSASLYFPEDTVGTYTPAVFKKVPDLQCEE